MARKRRNIRAYNSRKKKKNIRAYNSRKRSLAAKKAWKTRRANERKRSLAAKKSWKTRRANERKKSKATSRKKKKQNLLDRERIAFRLKDQRGDQLEERLAGKKKADVTIRIEAEDGTVRERTESIPIDEDDPDSFWRDYFEFARDEVDSFEDEEGYSYDEVGVTVTSVS